MAYFIKPGLWESFRKAPKGWLNLLDAIKGLLAKEFTGEVSLGNPNGIFYPTHTQTGPITLSATDVGRPGGFAYVEIVANGDTITVPSDWVLLSDTPISTNSGDTNNIAISYMGHDRIQYGVIVKSA